MQNKIAMMVAVSVVLAFNLAVPPSHAGLTGRIVVAGYGPELPVMQDLGRAFEKTHPGAAIDFEWDKNVKAVDLVKNGEATIAVTDRPDLALKMTPVAWDGLAVIVNFANPVREVSTAQIKDLFTGKITRWSDLDAGDQKVEVVARTPEDNVQPGFEASLGIAGRIRASGKPVWTDEKALRLVSGRDGAITMISLASALRAQEDGIPIRILTVDKIEPGLPTVQNGTYGIRRPILLLARQQPDPLTEAFIKFALLLDGQAILQRTFVPHLPGRFEVLTPPSQLADDPDASPGRPRT
jgi:phosphate transport system substrate-binding protein